MNKDRKPITVIDQLKSETCIIAPDRTGPIVDPMLSPQLISPVIIPYVCTLSLGCPLTLGKKNMAVSHSMESKQKGFNISMPRRVTTESVLIRAKTLMQKLSNRSILFIF